MSHGQTTTPNTTTQAAPAAHGAGGTTNPNPNALYINSTWWIFTGIIGLAVVLNLFSIFWAWRSRHALRRPPPSHSSDNENSRATTSGRGRVSIRRLPNAILTSCRIVAFRWRVPFLSGTILELFLAFSYLAILFVYALIQSKDVTPKVIQKRAGELVIAQLPILVALAMKNNVIQFLTGVSHEKLNLLHRALSRAALLLTLIHFWALIAEDAKIFRNTWRKIGLLAGLAQTLLTLLSIRPIRKRFYEFFFLGHVILVFVFIVGAYVHATGSNPKYGKYIWPSFLIWGADRLCRYIRYLILSNFHAPNASPATLELITPDTLRITVRRKFYLQNVPLSSFRGGWTPGQHMFVAFPTIGPIESHPFTVASIPEAGERKGEENEYELVWIIRARSGFTRRLKEHVLMKNKNAIEMGVDNGPWSCKLPVFMDGPYGAPQDLSRFETCVFIAGGSGVAYTLPRMRHILNEVSSQSACARRVIFIWAVRHISHIKWIAADLAKAVASVPPQVELTIAIYITSRSGEDTPELRRSSSAGSSTKQPGTPDTIEAPSLDEKQNPTILPVDDEKRSAPLSEFDDMKGVDLFDGRPNVHEILEDAVTTASGPVSVDASGPDPLVDSIRIALSAPFAGPRSVLRGVAPEVQLNVEEFTM